MGLFFYFGEIIFVSLRREPSVDKNETLIL